MPFGEAGPPALAQVNPDEGPRRSRPAPFHHAAPPGQLRRLLRLRPPPPHLLAHAEHRLRLRRPGHAAAGREPVASVPRRGVPLDAAVVPGLLLLVARDLVLSDPPRVLAWRALHDPRLQALPSWLLPRPPADLDRDPFALALAAAASGLALLYLVGALAGWGVRARAWILAVAAAAVVIVPTAGFVAMGEITGRPYGQDGGVVQLPLAMERILAGETPYGADYSRSMLGRQARVSDFWAEHGGNPILRHHAYLPGTHLLTLPFYAAGRVVGLFDPRMATLVAWAAAALLAARLAGGGARGLSAAALVLVNPLVYWHQVFGANDLLPGALLLGSVALARRGRPALAGALLGLACAAKQLAWPFAPFLLAWMSGAGSWRELAAAEAWRRVARPAIAAAAVFALVVLPVAALDLRAFWSDVFVYNAGLAGGDNYPLGGTPGFGAANFVLYAGGVATLRDHVSFAPFYLLLVPIGFLLLDRVLRRRSAAAALAAGSAALLLSLYVSRVAHPNYLVLAAVLLPLALLMGDEAGADAAVVPLGLLAVAVELVENAVLQLVWADAVAARLPQHLGAMAGALAPRGGPHLTLDPLGLAVAALAAGIGIAYLVVALLARAWAARAALLAAGVFAAATIPLAATSAAGRASGVVRVQADWAASALERPAAELFSRSFRREPARTVFPASWEPLVPPLGAEPRWAALVALLVGAAIAGTLAGGTALAVAGAALVPPPGALGVLYGSGEAFVLGAVALVAWLTRRRASRLARIAPLAAGGTLAAVRLLPASASPVPAEGLGLVNLALYRGAWTEMLVWSMMAVALAAFALAVRAVAREPDEPRRYALTAAGLVALSWFAVSGSAHDVLSPLVLLALAASRIDPAAGDR
jgi:hypothetical protein